MNNLLVSKFVDVDTFVHRLDPRSKLFFSTLYLIVTFLSKSIIEFLILFLLLLIAIYLSRTSWTYILSSLKLILFLMVFTAIVHLIFNQEGNVVFTVGRYNLYSNALQSIVLVFVRFFLVVAMMTILTVTTSPNSITYAIEKAFDFLNRLGLNVSTFALLMSISLRFIPTIAEETNRIIKAQTSRGARFNKGGFISKAKAFVPILIPIFVSTLKRADELATAMEVRGYDPDRSRTRYKQLRYKKWDYLVYLIIVSVSIFIILK
ncbi:energy-coupling factor transporter transmembrane protein EcfT [Gemella sp. 19428wG2_WT2a]|nr:energy-coupling factor transporter transmembrane protein EcfT [Gemella sp. 19428wG2_WT2a]TFU60189.1 energy-coupling factor transporter transmembrane protein EcfT [Gemella sp. WT2a]